jgi:hypothetical protein
MNLAENLVTSARDHRDNVAIWLDATAISYLQLEDLWADLRRNTAGHVQAPRRDSRSARGAAPRHCPRSPIRSPASRSQNQCLSIYIPASNPLRGAIASQEGTDDVRVA